MKLTCNRVNSFAVRYADGCTDINWSELTLNTWGLLSICQLYPCRGKDLRSTTVALTYSSLGLLKAGYWCRPVTNLQVSTKFPYKSTSSSWLIYSLTCTIHLYDGQVTHPCDETSHQSHCLPLYNSRQAEESKGTDCERVCPNEELTWTWGTCRFNESREFLNLNNF
jgi:hypothetical protein